MNQMTPINPSTSSGQAPQGKSIPPQTVQTPGSSKSWLGWLIGGLIVVLAAIGVLAWMMYGTGPAEKTVPSPVLEGTLPTSEPVPGESQLTAGNSLEEIQQDFDTTQLEEADSDFASLEQEAQAVP